MRYLERAWYENHAWLYPLWPLSLLYRLLAACRRWYQSAAARCPGKQPVIVIGNISVGGAGKTSLLIALARELKGRGYRPGIVSRGYGASAKRFPLLVEADSDPGLCGDEPVLIATRSACPVVVDPDRPAALAHLLDNFEVDLVLSDDGLQHYRMHRDIEVVVVDGARRLGNGMCLPAGPLREPAKRLREVDLIVVNTPPNGPHAPTGGEKQSAAVAALAGPVPVYHASMEAHCLENLVNGEKYPLAGAPIAGATALQAVSAIGNPRRFHAMLESLPCAIVPIDFPDHHRYRPQDFRGPRIDPRLPVVMTEKDAVKCRHFAEANFWVLRADMVLPAELIEDLLQRIEQAPA